MEMSIQEKLCPCCLSTDITPYGVKNNFRFEHCRRCQFVFVNPRPDAAALMSYYLKVGGHGVNSIASTSEALEREANFPNSILDARRIIKRVRSMSPGAVSLLDVGAGYGFFSKEAIDAGFTNVDALEFDEDACRICKKISGISPISEGFESFESPRGSYDCILMSQVLEHASDIRLWTNKAKSLLEPNGVLLIAVPNYASFLATALKLNDPFVIPPDHLNYFNSLALSLLLKESGFEVIQTETVSRLRPDVLSRRLPIHHEPIRQLVNKMTATAQKSSFALVDKLNKGLFLNMYARPCTL